MSKPNISDGAAERYVACALFWNSLTFHAVFDILAKGYHTDMHADNAPGSGIGVRKNLYEPFNLTLIRVHICGGINETQRNFETVQLN